jgi:flagellin
MSYLIGPNPTALNVYNNLGVHQRDAATALAKVSSGSEAAGGVNVAAAGVAATRQGHLQGTLNNISVAQTSLNQLMVIDAAYAEMAAIAQKGIEVGSRAGDSGADTTAIFDQLDALGDALISLDANTEYAGAAAVATITAAIGVGNLVATHAALDFADGGAIGLGANGAKTATQFTTALGAIVDGRAENAAYIAAFQSTLQVLNSTAANELAAISQVENTDIAKEMMNLTAANIMTEAATAMLAQAMQMPNSVLKLLQ